MMEKPESYMKANSEVIVEPPIEVDPNSLSPEAVQGILESFVLREGTDYGSTEISLEKKVENLQRKIRRKEIVLVFDPQSESIAFLTQTEWAKLQKAQLNPLT